MASLSKVEVILGTSDFERMNCGLRRLLVLIGKNEIRLKENNAILKGKRSFTIKTGKKSERIKCNVGDIDNLKASIYYRMGLNRMSHLMRRGMRNKSAIKALIRYSDLRWLPDDNDQETEHYIFYIHRFASPVFFECLYRYIRNEFDKPAAVLQSVYDSLPHFFGGMQAKGSNIVGNPYLTQIRIMPPFWKKSEILSAIDKFDNVL